MNEQKNWQRSLELFLLFSRTYDLLSRQVEGRLRELGISQAQYSALRHLDREETISLSELGERMVRGPSNLTTLCRRLEQAGLVETVVSGDRREKRLRLTGQGWLLRERVVPAHRQHLQEIFACLNGEEKERLRESLLRIQDVCRKNQGNS